EAEELAREPRVRVAVTDVAGAVLVDDLRLDVLLQSLRDRQGDLAHGGRHAAADVDGPAVGAVPGEHERTAAGDVAHVDEVTRLVSVLEDERRSIVDETGGEDRGNAGVGIGER